ncbi:MAG TPA: MFS transporter [Candidatus Binataceae bacterium]|jgi:MFS family permease|nr:MFS transporter [Candidatus Binataceae bacterium]
MTSQQRQGWMMVAVLFVVMAIFVGCLDSMAVLFTPLLKHFGWSRARLSAVMSVISIALGLSTPVAGWFVDRIGARAVIAAGLAISGAGLLIASQSNSAFALGAGCALFGVGGGGASLVSASYVIANWFGENRGIAMGVMMMGTSTGAALAAPLVSHVVTRAGWRWGFVAEAVAVLAVALPLAAVQIRTRDDRADVHGLAPVRALGGVDVEQALRTRSFWLYCLILAMFGIVGAAVNLHLVTFLLTDGFQATLAAWVLSTYYIGATVAKPILGAMTDRLGVRGGLCLALLFMGTSCALLPHVGDHRIVFMLAATYGMGIGGPVALMPLLGVEAFGLKRYGTLMGLAGLVQMGSGFIGPVAAGAFFDRFGSYSPVFTLLGVILVATSLLPFACGNTQPESDRLLAA